MVVTDVTEGAGPKLVDEIRGRFLQHGVTDEDRWTDVAKAALKNSGGIAMIAYPASDETGYVTGASFRVDGGWSVTSAGVGSFLS